MISFAQLSISNSLTIYWDWAELQSFALQFSQSWSQQNLTQLPYLNAMCRLWWIRDSVLPPTFWFFFSNIFKALLPLWRLELALLCFVPFCVWIKVDSMAAKPIHLFSVVSPLILFTLLLKPPYFIIVIYVMLLLELHAINMRTP